MHVDLFAALDILNQHLSWSHPNNFHFPLHVCNAIDAGSRTYLRNLGVKKLQASLVEEHRTSPVIRVDSIDYTDKAF